MSSLRKIVAPKVTRYMDPRDFLQDLYNNAKAELESYSYLAFSEELGFSRSNVVHLMIRGKRPLTEKAAAKIAETLGMKGSDKRYWMLLVSYHGSRDSQERETFMREMLDIKTREIQASDTLLLQLEFFTEWYHSAIYELAFTDSFHPDPKVLASRLHPRIRPEQARKSLLLLERMRLLVPEGDSYRPAQARLSTGDEIASMAIARYHQCMIDLGKDSLSSTEGADRDVSAISFACPASMIPDLKQRISRFRKDLLDEAQKREGADVVYQMNIQLFPLTRKKGNAS